MKINEEKTNIKMALKYSPNIYFLYITALFEFQNKLTDTHL